MRIGVDYRLASSHLGGMAVFLKNLMAALEKTDSRNEYILLDDNPNKKAGFKKEASTVIREHVWLQRRLPELFKMNRIDAAYFPNPPVAFFLNLPILLTIPDVSFMHDAAFPGWLKFYLWVMYFWSAHKAKVITTFSINSKNDIVKFFKINPNKITVMTLAASDEISALKSKVGLRYIISVPGTFIRRKNIEETILAFSRLPRNLKRAIQLVLVGYAQGQEFERIKSLVGKLNLDGQVIFTGRVTDQELSALYSRAELFVCSSLYEGFGLPILEAMKCGVPVISYENSSLSEVVGPAGILVSNVDDLSLGMERVLNNPKLRSKLKSMGLKRAATYSWERTAEEFLSGLAKIC